MRTRDRIISLAALSLMLGLAPVFALDGTPRPSGDAAAPAPVQTPPSPAHSRGGDIPRPPGAIPNAGAAMAVGLPATSLPRPRAPVPVLSTTPSTATAPAIDRPLPPPTAFAAPTIPITPFEAFKSGARAMRDGQKQKGVRSLEYAAEQGVVAAQWKLGRMYAEGDGVDQSDVKAFEYFRRIADSHAEDNPNGPESRYIANAFVSLGHYYREGIAESEVRADRARARTPSIISPASCSTEPRRRMAMPVRRRAGSTLPPTRGRPRRRPCSAACCSRASLACPARPRVD
jgi:hypothetical protein